MNTARERYEPYIYEKGQLQRPRRILRDGAGNQRTDREAGEVAADCYQRCARPILCIQLGDPCCASASCKSDRESAQHAGNEQPRWIVAKK
jgi:hypothetical protein